MRPRIGITAYWLEASWGPWSGMPACLAPQAYVEAILGAGGFPLLVPPLPEMAGFADEALATIDGLILVGGSDVGASTYGAEAHPTNDPPNERRDTAELALLRGALDRDMPVLGICRGFQLLSFGPAQPLQVGRLAVEVLEVGRDLIDSEGLLAQRYDGRPGTVYLFRPDQYVAARWRSFDPLRVEAAVRKALAQEFPA